MRSSRGKNQAGAVLRDHSNTMVEKTSLVSHDDTITSRLPCPTPTKHLDFAVEQITARAVVLKNEINGHSVIKQSF